MKVGESKEKKFKTQMEYKFRIGKRSQTLAALIEFEGKKWGMEIPSIKTFDRSAGVAGYYAAKRRKELTIDAFQKHYIRNYFALSKDKIRHFDEGLYVSPHSLIFSRILKISRKISHIVGCNWSCYKKDLVMINGYDEDFTLPTTGEDSDIERRLLHFGVAMKSCRSAAIVVHLFHDKVFSPEISKQTEALMQSKSDIFVCKNGLKKY